MDEILALSSTKLRFAKRLLRIQACKTVPPKPATVHAVDPKNSKVKTAKSEAIPKGDPKLGELLKGLSKEERRIAKSADADRQARRLAKKRLKIKAGLDKEKGSVKLGVTRVAGDRKPKIKAKNGRIRSEHALAKMKGSRV